MCSCVVSEARLFFCTGTPVQPHDSQNLEGLGVEVRWMMIPPGVWASINLSTALKSYTAFVGHFGLEEESQGCDQDPPPGLPEFVPCAAGCSYELPDGVTVQIRMQRVAGTYQPQWCQLCNNHIVCEACMYWSLHTEFRCTFTVWYM